ncbi:hypothetical protein ACU4HD_43370 [Cupriavidus basilensis]
MSDPKDQKPGQFDDAGRRTHEGQRRPTRCSTLLPPPREGGKRRRWGIWVVIIILVLIGAMRSITRSTATRAAPVGEVAPVAAARPWPASRCP